MAKPDGIYKQPDGSTLIIAGNGKYRTRVNGEVNIVTDEDQMTVVGENGGTTIIGNNQHVTINRTLKRRTGK